MIFIATLKTSTFQQYAALCKPNLPDFYNSMQSSNPIFLQKYAILEPYFFTIASNPLVNQLMFYKNLNRISLKNLGTIVSKRKAEKMVNKNLN